MHRDYVDEGRREWANDAPRPLAATIWYPASEDADEREWAVETFRFGQSALDAPLAPGDRRPLVLVSHGTGGSAAQLSWLAEPLAHAGFIVAGVNHHGNTAAEARQWPHGFVLAGDRVRDLSALIDRLLADPVLGTAIDAQRIGAAGFSLGGYSVLALGGAWISFEQRRARCAAQPGNPVCQLPPEAGFGEDGLHALAAADAAFQAGLARDALPAPDPRVRAVFSMAPAFVSLMDAAQLQPLSGLPVQVVLAENDALVLAGPTRRAITAGLPGHAPAIVEGAGHYVFLSGCSDLGRRVLPLFCVDADGIDRNAVHERVAMQALALFGQALQAPARE